MNIFTKQTTPPTITPVSVDDIKSHLRIDHASDDDLLQEYLNAATQAVENYVHRQLITATFKQYRDAFPSSGMIILDRPPLLTVTSITYTDTDGATQTWPTNQYTVVADAILGYVVPSYDSSGFPSTRDVPNAVTITYTAGYGATAASVPASIRQIIRNWTGDMYAKRETISDTNVIIVPGWVERALIPYKVIKFRGCE